MLGSLWECHASVQNWLQFQNLDVLRTQDKHTQVTHIRQVMGVLVVFGGLVAFLALESL